MLAFGLFDHPNAYFKNGWNYLDFVIVMEGITSGFILTASTINLSALRTLRVLRPLRTITVSVYMLFV